MKESTTGRRARLGPIAALLVPLFGVIAYSAPANCPTGTATDGAFTIPGTGTTNNNTLGVYNNAVLSNASCNAVDKNFSNFSTNGGGSVDQGHTYFFANNPADPTVTPIALTFATVRGNLSGTDGQNEDGINNYTATGTAGGATTLTNNVTYAVDIASGNDQITAINLSLADVSIGAGLGASVSIVVNLCENMNTTTIPNNFSGSNGCSAVGETFVAGAFTANAGNGYTVTFTLPTPETRIGIASIWTIDSGAGSSSTSSFLTWTESFDQLQEAPEPSAFFLLGAALSGVALLRCYQSGLFTRAFGAFSQSATARMGMIAPPAETVEFVGDTRQAKTWFRALRRGGQASRSGPPSTE